MISVQEAQAAVLAAAQLRPVEQVSLSEAAGRFLAEDFPAPYPLPIFDSSAMDGYAVRIADIEGAESFPNEEMIKAGEQGGSPIKVMGEIKA